MKYGTGTGGSFPFSLEGVSHERTHVFSVSSGKGGAGVTHSVINLAVEIQRRGQRVLVLEADLGLSNIAIFLGISPGRDLSHLLMGTARIREVMLSGPEGVMILPGGFGVGEIASLTDEQKLRLICETEDLERDFDIVLVDTGAGISPNVIFFNLVPRHNIIIVGPEPSSISGAYALMKVLAVRYRRKRFNLILNGIRCDSEGKKVYDRLSLACHRLLNVSLCLLGTIPWDDRVSESMREKRPVVLRDPQAALSRSFGEIADRLVRMAPYGGNPGSLRFFSENRLSPDQIDQMKLLSEYSSR